MADELFNGVYAVNMSLAEAIRRKILPLPVYVTSWYSFRGDIEQLEMKAELDVGIEKDIREAYPKQGREVHCVLPKCGTASANGQ